MQQQVLVLTKFNSLKNPSQITAAGFLLNY
jgi:hypothetical protein